MLLILSFSICSKRGRGSKFIGGIHISPIILSFKSLLQKLTNSLASDWLIPFFWISSPIFIWIKYFIFLLELNSRSENFFASFSLSSVCIKSNNTKASLALLDWSLPIRCSWMFLLFTKKSLHFSFASWTLFSPKCKCPFWIIGKIVSKDLFFVTTITLDIAFNLKIYSFIAL